MASVLQQLRLEGVALALRRPSATSQASTGQLRPRERLSVVLSVDSEDGSWWRERHLFWQMAGVSPSQWEVSTTE